VSPRRPPRRSGILLQHAVDYTLRGVPIALESYGLGSAAGAGDVYEPPSSEPNRPSRSGRAPCSVMYRSCTSRPEARRWTTRGRLQARWPGIEVVAAAKRCASPSRKSIA